MKPTEFDTNAPLRQQIRQSFKGFVPEVLNTSKNFAKLGLVYSLVECFIERDRAIHDTYNAVYAGCITGASLAWRGGVGGMTGGCIMFAAFSGLIEHFQPFGGLE